MCCGTFPDRLGHSAAGALASLEGELRALAQIGRIHRWRGTSQEGLIRLLPLLKRLPKTSASAGTGAFKESEAARQRFEEAVEICARLGENLYARSFERLLEKSGTPMTGGEK